MLWLGVVAHYLGAEILTRTGFEGTRIIRFVRIIQQANIWIFRRFDSPSPTFVKHSRLRKYHVDCATWIESGTFHGLTTKMLSNLGDFVYSVEPGTTLFRNAEKYFSRYKNVEILNGTSEEIFPNLLKEINGNVCFWLDGHYSGGDTFLGANETPIIAELVAIQENLEHFGQVAVLIDDVRCFNPSNSQYATYPTLDYLVHWAHNCGFSWTIEHDIFIAFNRR